MDIKKRALAAIDMYRDVPEMYYLNAEECVSVRPTRWVGPEYKTIWEIFVNDRYVKLIWLPPLWFWEE